MAVQGPARAAGNGPLPAPGVQLPGKARARRLFVRDDSRARDQAKRAPGRRGRRGHAGVRGAEAPAVRSGRRAREQAAGSGAAGRAGEGSAKKGRKEREKSFDKPR